MSITICVALGIDCNGIQIDGIGGTDFDRVCDGTNCTVIPKTIYDSCDKDGDYTTIPLSIGCIVDEYNGTSADIECSNGYCSFVYIVQSDIHFVSVLCQAILCFLYFWN